MHTLVTDTEEQRGHFYGTTSPTAVRNRTVSDCVWAGLFGLFGATGAVCGGVAGDCPDCQCSLLWKIGEAVDRYACSGREESKIGKRYFASSVWYP